MDDDLKQTIEAAGSPPDLLIYGSLVQVLRDEHARLNALRTAVDAEFLVQEQTTELYQKCLELACMLRHQNMSTTTTEKTEDAIIQSSLRIARKLYQGAAQELALLGALEVKQFQG